MSHSDTFLDTVDEVDEDDDSNNIRRQPHLPNPGHDAGLAASWLPRSTTGDSSDNESSESSRNRLSYGLLATRQIIPRKEPSIDEENQGSQGTSTPTSAARQSRTQKRQGLFSRLSSDHGGSLDDTILKQSALRRSSGRTGTLQTGGRTLGSSMTFSIRSASSKLATQDEAEAAAAASTTQEQDKARATYRRYRVGDSVLVCNIQSRLATLVNRHGYPSGGGLSPEEQRGPYIYVLAMVKKVHFEEDAEYYTVTRADTGADQRADAEWMEHLGTARGKAAALRAATENQLNDSSSRGIGGVRVAGGPTHKKRSDTKCIETLKTIVCISLIPFYWLGECFVSVVGERLYKLGASAHAATRRHGQLFLNGMKPYACSIRITLVNLLVLCSLWYMFIDQARLAFFPPSSDDTLAVVSLLAWIFLVIELLCEVFIRPDGYNNLIVSEKAFAPSTVRYINSFHLLVESLSLVVFIPEFLCLWSTAYTCGDRPAFSFFNAAYMAVLGPYRSDAFYGRAYMALIRLRVFGLGRHWKKMWINNTFVIGHWTSLKGGLFSGVFIPSRIVPNKFENRKIGLLTGDNKGNSLTNASNIGTALMVTNSHRALMILCIIMGLFPILGTFNTNGGANNVSLEMTMQLQAMNTEFVNATSEEECSFFIQSLMSWVVGVTGGARPSASPDGSIFLLQLSVEPLRCENFFPLYDGSVTNSFCKYFDNNRSLPTLNVDEERVNAVCRIWRSTYSSSTLPELAAIANIRTGAISVQTESSEGVLISYNGNVTSTFRVSASYNQSYSIDPAALSSFLLQLSLLICVLGGLSVLRRDSGVLVLGPLRRMLKIVARYAKNPLSTVKTGGKGDESDDDEGSDSGERGNPEDKLGSYETEQLISAVSKITDLLRKCWGVAGADIISTNLATQEGALTEVFNPTVPGKSVYALFGFAAINDFDHILRQLGGEVMILINDVAAVLHGEVFRWGFGDSGQCNKNLGSAFLMVFRIGLVKEVIQKLEQATDVVFSTTTSKKTGFRKRSKNAKKLSHGDNSFSNLAITRSVMNERRRKSQRAANSSRAAMSLSLQSLPGISTFTDRAVIGMLKSFAGIYRDNKLLQWKNDFRLGAGVGAFSVNMIFGMDAGWAVEGAVGSEYKIDATYLSPHVNMASRMMSACKQYGVSILLSQAVQELMSETARSKLRHLDTVTVKGSSLKQKIFTYDARHKGVAFFLFSRSDEQADLDSDHYTPNIWITDQDLRAMRRHVTEDFEKEFNKGRDAYLAGDWVKALKHLEAANEIMVENVMDQGYIQDELNELQNRILDGEDARAAEEELRTETGDGPSRRLIAYMESEGKIAPEGWKGYHPLTSK